VARRRSNFEFSIAGPAAVTKSKNALAEIFGPSSAGPSATVVWLWWIITTGLLIGGWISTLLQIIVLIGVVYVLKYGWQRAPRQPLPFVATL